MTRVLLSGMSATGKSTVLAALAGLGYRTADTDYGWSRHAADGEWIWDEDKTAELLDVDVDDDVVFVAGTASNQARFYPRFDHVILLSAPTEVVLERLAMRTNNPFGKVEAERNQVLADLESIEPLLRRGAGYEIDTSQPIDVVVNEVLRIVGL